MYRPEIDIIGSGSLASSLAPALELNGYVINNVYGRTLKSAKEIAGRLYQANTKDTLDLSDSKSTVFILAITDDSIEELARELVLPEQAIVAHTSGSKALSVLGYTASPNIGVFYPIQTFSKAKRVDFKGVPILIEGENSYTEKTLSQIAQTISGSTRVANTKERRMIHLAAIFASNFTNAMLFQANELMLAARAKPELLAPLIAETVNKSMVLGPEKAQTGPAARGDLEILDNHIEMLEKFPELQETYKLISQQIINRSETD